MIRYRCKAELSIRVVHLITVATDIVISHLATFMKKNTKRYAVFIGKRLNKII